MSTRCRTHQAESSPIDSPQRLGGQFPPPSGCRAFFIYATVRLDLHHSGRVTRFRDFDIESMRRNASSDAPGDPAATNAVASSLKDGWVFML